jgi:SAM-dependent methyltransferase
MKRTFYISKTVKAVPNFTFFTRYIMPMQNSNFRRGSTSRATKFINSRYNQFWKLRLNLLDERIINPNNFLDKTDLKHSNAYVLSWLRNFDKIVRTVTQFCPIEKLDLLDVGCGTGALLIYAEHRYMFNSYYGFDLQPNLIEIANQRIRQRALTERIQCECINAKIAKIRDCRQLIYLFNPFSSTINKLFFDNNWDKIRQNRCFIGLSNDYALESLVTKTGSKLLWRDSKKKISLLELS